MRWLVIILVAIIFLSCSKKETVANVTVLEYGTGIPLLEQV